MGIWHIPVNVMTLFSIHEIQFAQTRPQHCQTTAEKTPCKTEYLNVKRRKLIEWTTMVIGG